MFHAFFRVCVRTGRPDLRYRYKEYKSTRDFADVVDSALKCSFHRRALLDMHIFRSHRHIKSRPIGNYLTINCLQTADTCFGHAIKGSPRLYGHSVCAFENNTPAKSNYNPGAWMADRSFNIGRTGWTSNFANN